MSIPLFDWLKDRSAGVLMHISSLPCDLGIGTFGQEARDFVDFLNCSGVQYWQICPLGPTGFGDSPYQCFSAFAGNPYFINLHDFVSCGLLSPAALTPLQQLPQDHVDFGALFKCHASILHQVYQNFLVHPSKLPFHQEWEKFQADEAHWLLSYAAFKAFKDHFHSKPWFEWPAEYKTFAQATKMPLFKELADSIKAYQFFQFVFFHQWFALKDYANAKGVDIIGDVPIFVAMDSADVWANPQLFQMEGEGRKPLAFAGVPPDYFSALGQFWGNPLYDWDNCSRQVYYWWMKRLEMNFRLFDIVRLDHFRGFQAYWSVPADAPDARSGKWIQGPGLNFFEALKRKFPEARIIAEDLGLITPEVRSLIKDTGFPHMAIFQFAFDNDSDNLFLPHNLNPKLITYTGTHDNNTSRGWYDSLDPQYQDQVRRYLRVSAEDIAWDLIHLAYQSVSNLVIVSVQDLLNKDTSARMNLPGTSQGNWQWRCQPQELSHLFSQVAPYLCEIKSLYQR